MKAPESTAVKFDPNPLQEAASPIYTPDAVAANLGNSPRPSRQINFVDDGKLFEGHFTLHTRGLKSLIQLLMDQQSEQQIIISDLQDQMSTMREQIAKMRKAVAGSPRYAARVGSGDSGTSRKEVDDLRNRVKQLEGFRALWGLRPEEVDTLVSTYGDPVVTPQEYTACILNLQPFRLLRNETRTSVVSLMERRASPSARQIAEEREGRNQNARDDSRSRREESRGGRDRSGREESRGERDRSGREESRGERDRSGREESRGARDRSGREESRGERDRSAREVSRGARDRDTPDGSQGGRDHNTPEESRGARDRSAREVSRGARDRSPREESRGERDRSGREESRGERDRSGREESRGARDRSAREVSRGARDRSPREESRGERDRSAREESRGERDRSGREESRGERDRSAREESRGERDRSPREESRGERDRSAREVSRGARDRSRRDDSRGSAERDVREEFYNRGASREEDRVSFGDGESLRSLANRLDVLEQKLKKIGAMGSSSSRQATSAPGHSSVSPAEFVDEQARDSIEELTRFVTRRLKELEKTISKSRDVSPAAAPSDSSPTRGGGSFVRRSERSPIKRSLTPPENITNSQKNTASATTGIGESAVGDAKAKRERKSPADYGVVDIVAREDAGAALDHVAQLEKFVSRKLKELSLSIGKDLGSISMRPSGESEHPAALDRKPQAGGSAVDQMARDDAARSLEAVQDLEEDWGKRWQSLEERLRIIGRASMNKGSLHTASAYSSIDRKAREDASMSLMRIQQLEREIVGLRRLFMSQKALMPTVEAGNSETQGSGSIVFPVPPKVQRQTTVLSSEKQSEGAATSGDVEYQTRMHDLEEEVEQRMEEVNRALATLRSTQSGLIYNNSTMAGHALNGKNPETPGKVVINSRSNDNMDFLDPPLTFPHSPKSQPGMLVMTSSEGGAEMNGYIEAMGMRQGDGGIVLRSPQLGSFGGPLLTRELTGVMEAPLYGMQHGGATDLPQGNSSSVPHHPMNASRNLPLAGSMSNPSDGGGVATAAALKLDAASANTSTTTPVTRIITNATTSEDARLQQSSASLPTGDREGSVSPRDRTGELDQLRSHSRRLRNISLTPRGKMEEGFLVEQSALGHTTPCVVYNCAWCAAQKGRSSAQTARAAH